MAICWLTQFLKLLLKKFCKGLINLAVAGPQEFFKQHLINNEEQQTFYMAGKVYYGWTQALYIRFEISMRT